jgi:hypothetical protein
MTRMGMATSLMVIVEGDEDGMDHLMGAMDQVEATVMEAGGMGLLMEAMGQLEAVHPILFQHLCQLLILYRGMAKPQLQSVSFPLFIFFCFMILIPFCKSYFL